ncbi:diguanylate cyclase (GGDEF) domain-containing protein [Desulfoscipio geothermicus DSM 3669]|uniref:Diguanylate cyclase (GGDEF) domain-containing protein n=1 Tax=Desulfoscipio geothermicus DSM 3669 TaxID=1121426 RepID=A0A1I6EIT3_9FIRM|nr:diguanylate cyclase (GGDEF) domain-containing protein [Desulfoscipio geothermicus DSM 3669]
MSIIIGDVNGLKLTNDAFGHQKGDELLKNIARILKNSCRKEDIVARWGGDEFAILLPKTSAKSAEAICRHIKQRCDDAGADPIPLSIALGTATKEKTADDKQEVINRAEDKMYRNKLQESKNLRSEIIVFLKKLLQEKNHETEDHTIRLQKMALHISNALNLPDNQLNDLLLLATFHDIGKIVIPYEILWKRDRLTPEEWEVVRRHPEIG